MTKPDQCPKCGGPVFRGMSNPPDEGTDGIHALPDTLEEIEAAVQELDEMDGYAFFHQALIRLFNGCATCGRERLVESKLVHDLEATLTGYAYDAANARSQAFMEAAEMADNCADNCTCQHFPTGKSQCEQCEPVRLLAADLRQRAERTKP